jgi:predicted DNA-binding protein YlxM (UPF0122 family)
MKDDTQFMRLWDLYSPLLTATQREITDLYFNFDLSLAEIAEQKGVSRQSVSDCLNKSRKQLEEYEKKLGVDKLLTDGDHAFSSYMTEVNRWIAKNKQKMEWQTELKELEERLNGVLTECGVELVED